MNKDVFQMFFVTAILTIRNILEKRKGSRLKTAFLCSMINICMELTWETALQAANVLVFLHTGEYLSDVETIILHGAWMNHTYKEIAEAQNYTSSYLCRDVGHKLWDNLTTALKVEVSKTNFKTALKREWQKYIQAVLDPNRNRLAKLLETENIALFEGLVALNSTIYIERSPVEKICYETILRPRALIRIEGAKWMGKTCLIKHIFEQENLRSQRTVYLDFNRINRETIQDIDKLLRWLSAKVSLHLNLENKVEHYYNQSIRKHNNNCTAYFANCILSEIKNGVVLALDNIDCLFSHQKVTHKFLKLLHDWHEKAKINRHWSKLKLIITQSTNASIPSDVSCSLLKLGTLIVLKEFSFEQVKTLAQFYELDWDDFTICRLINEVGGHPYLVRLAMHQAKTQNIA